MSLFIDIETIPQQPEEEAKAEIAKTIQAPAQMSKAETIAAWHAGEGSYAGVKDSLIEETYRKTSFDGAKGEVISIAFAVDDDPVLFVHRGIYPNESEMLSAAKDAILTPMYNRTRSVSNETKCSDVATPCYANIYCRKMNYAANRR